MAAGFLTFTIALITSLAATVPVRQFAVRVGMVDRPGPRKIHLAPIPLLGGVAIYAAVLVAVLVFYPGHALSEVLGILAAASLLLLVGTLDDRGLLHHQVKLFLAMPAAALIAISSGIRTNIFSTAFLGSFGFRADVLLSVFWITAITAAFSILDYMDGVCAGIAAIVAFFLAVLGILSGQVLVSTFAAAVVGAALGFLKWNFSPAKIFMGDGGAMLLGFLVATLALRLRVAAVSPHADWLAPVLVLAVPIFDTALVCVSRLRRGLVPFTSPGKDHTGHRLANSGLGIRFSVLILYAMGVGFGSLAILSTWLESIWVDRLAVLVLLFLIAAIALLESFPYERQDSRPEPSA